MNINLINYCRRQEILEINQEKKSTNEGFPSPPVFNSREDLTASQERPSTPNSARPSFRPPPAPGGKPKKPVQPVLPFNYSKPPLKTSPTPPSEDLKTTGYESKPLVKPIWPPVPNAKSKPPPHVPNAKPKPPPPPKR